MSQAVATSRGTAWRGLLALQALVACPCTHAQDVTHTRASIPLTHLISFETLRLPGDERMGLLGTSLLFDIDGRWSIGPAVYAAATGQRGGLFVGGVQLQREWTIVDGLALSAGLFAGGGGGAAAPVGSGLMLRPALTLLKDLGAAWQVGLSWSSVRFPSGQIASSQIGLALAWRGSFNVATGPGEAAHGSRSGGSSLGPADGLGVERVAATLGEYRFGDSAGRHIMLAGARADWAAWREGWRWGLEAAAAAHGDAAGYMEVLGSLAVGTVPVPREAPSWSVGARASLGLAGGGAVPTGGGVIGKLGATTEWRLSPGWTIDAGAGELRAGSHTRALYAQVGLGIDLEPRGARRMLPDDAVVHTEWVAVLQHHSREPRSDGSRSSLDTIGLELNRYLGEHLYLSGQAHSAFAGGAGAFSVGLLGAGLATSATDRLRAGAELLVGAAGGGGVATGGGGRAQALAWAAFSPDDSSDWRAGVGRTQSLRGGTGSPLIELSWNRRFGLIVR